jgi:serine-threonine kinase receptor-associated protein
MGDHTASIKSIVWNVDFNILTTAADDKTVRWYDLRTQGPITQYKTERDITSCELSAHKYEDSDPGILSVAAGHSAIFFDAGRPGEVIKQVNFDHDIASVAINPSSGRFVTGGMKDTWVRVWDLEPQKEIEVLKGHHGPIWSTMFSPDGKIFATGSEDGTIKLWKACKEAYGLWR